MPALYECWRYPVRAVGGCERCYDVFGPDSSSEEEEEVRSEPIIVHVDTRSLCATYNSTASLHTILSNTQGLLLVALQGTHSLGSAVPTHFDICTTRPTHDRNLPKESGMGLR